MPKTAKVAFMFVAASYLLVNVLGTGKQKYLGDMLIYFFFTVLVNFAASGRRIKVGSVVKTSVLVLAGTVLLVEILRQRYLAAGIDLANFYLKSHPLIYWNENSPLVRIVGPDYGLAAGIFLGYFTSGMYGLYLSLTLPFEWTYMVGNSYSLGRIAEIIMHRDGSILYSTYPYRVGMEYGWGLDKWHSLFAWLASDITFTGVLILTPFFGFFYAKVWQHAVSARRPFAGPLFLYLSLGLMFSFANNQLMHALSGVFALGILSWGWLYFRIRRPKGHKRLPGTQQMPSVDARPFQ